MRPRPTTDSPSHKTQELIEQPDGSVEITLRLNNLIEVKHEILRWRELAEVLEPAALRTAVCESLTGPPRTIKTPREMLPSRRGRPAAEFAG